MLNIEGFRQIAACPVLKESAELECNKKTYPLSTDNELKILESIKKHGAISMKDVIEDTGIHKATVHVGRKVLFDAGLIECAGVVKKDRTRYKLWKAVDDE